MSATILEQPRSIPPDAAGHGERAPRRHRPLVQAHDLAKTFDVSAPWLNRVLERKPRQLLHAVDGVSFEIEAARRWRWWANPAAARARSRACWWACTSPRAAASPSTARTRTPRSRRPKAASCAGASR
jgi:hypothetical protein